MKHISQKDKGRGFSVELRWKSASLERSEAKFLLSVLPKKIKKWFIESFLYSGMNHVCINDVRKYFTDNSLICDAVFRNPGSAEAFDYLYHQKPVESDLDKYFLMCRAGAQIYQRLQALIENVPKIIKKQLASGNDKILLDNIGSGQGYDMIYVLKNNPDLRNYVHVRNIDVDSTPLEIGRKLVEDFGLQNNFEFVCNQVAKVHPREADLVLAIGYLCPLEERICKILLRSWRSYVKKGGKLIYSIILENMLLEDPVTDFIMTFLNWRMDYKPLYIANEIYKISGFKYENRFFDQPYRYHMMPILLRT